jgi:ParB family chromosome partitioning protein
MTMAQPIHQPTKTGLGRGLGKGFASLLPQDFNKNDLLTTASDHIEQLPVGSIVANPHQPRSHFDTTALQELANSIKEHGVIQPLIVTSTGKTYQLIAGERRWRASQLAGLKTVPAIIRTAAELQQLEVAILENVQRVDLSPLEQAVSIERWHQQFNVGYDTIAKRLGKAPSTINNTVRLLQLPEVARQALVVGEISEGHARSLLALKSDPERQLYLLKAIKTNEWSVRQTERFVTSWKAGVRDKTAAAERVSTETPATKALSQRLGTLVQVRRTAKGGKLEIGFKTDDDLQRILNLFS